MSTREETKREAGGQSAPIKTAGPPPPRTLKSSELLGPAHEVRIDHHGETYSLRRTSKGKLILTK